MAGENSAVSETDLQELVRQGESMTVEFKSDRGPLEDADLLNTVVCLAEGQGETLQIYVGPHPSTLHIWWARRLPDRRERMDFSRD